MSPNERNISGASTLWRWAAYRIGVPVLFLFFVVTLVLILKIQAGNLAHRVVTLPDGEVVRFRVYKEGEHVYVSARQRAAGLANGWSASSQLGRVDALQATGAQIVVDEPAGKVLLHAGKGLDAAFLRRLRFVVDIPFPDQGLRYRIWERAFPVGTPTEGLDVAALSRLDVTGGSIVVIAVNAAFLAAAEGEPVTMDRIARAARGEFRKHDKNFRATW